MLPCDRAYRDMLFRHDRVSPDLHDTFVRPSTLIRVHKAYACADNGTYVFVYVLELSQHV